MAYALAVTFVIVLFCSGLHFHLISRRPIPGADALASRVTLQEVVGPDLRFVRRIGAGALWAAAGISLTVLLFFFHQHQQWFGNPWAGEANILLFAAASSVLLCFAFEFAVDWRIWRKLAGHPQLHLYRRRFAWNRGAFYLAAIGSIAVVMHGI